MYKIFLKETIFFVFLSLLFMFVSKNKYYLINPIIKFIIEYV